MRTALFPAKFDQLEAIRDFAGQAARDAGLNDSDVYAVEVSVDEACTNVIEHAYKGIKGGDIECLCDAKSDYLTIVIRDHGKPFDPGDVPDPDFHAELKDRRIGGLGVYLMRRLMDEVHYETIESSGNVLTMVKHRSSRE
jgi:serine/threonine-protein kinase RsbW